MNEDEDEAFVRAIVDAPGDDTPRLVYADWLDDRDDPRGPYLRAEREAVQGGNIARLRELAVDLDPVWVARVSLPPVGVCIEEAEVTDRGPPVTLADIAAAACRLDGTLPSDYRAFLLNYNGGLIRRVWGEVDGEIIHTGADLWLYPLRPNSVAEKRGTLDGEAARHRERVNEPVSYDDGWLVPDIADGFLRHTRVGYLMTGDWVLLGVREPDIGWVRTFHDINMLGEHHRAAESRRELPTFAEFLARFLWPPPPLPPPARPVFDDCPF